VSILNIIDDQSRLCLGSDARRNTTGLKVVASFREAFDRWGITAGVLTDNGAVFTAKQRGEGRVVLEVELAVLGVKFDHSRPYHPQTCGMNHPAFLEALIP
jgi:transposase InsO family protein